MKEKITRRDFIRGMTAVATGSTLFTMAERFQEKNAAMAEDIPTEENAVFVDGVMLSSGLIEKNRHFYMRLSEAAVALQVELKDETDCISFEWRKNRVIIEKGSSSVEYKENERKLAQKTIIDGNDLLVPIQSFCESIEIGTLFDETFHTMYCTSGAGKWDVAPGYDVPVMMYHATGHADINYANLVMPPEHLEEQMQYLTNNGYSPIWFEDLWHIEDYEKPVILVFDDGWENNYRYLYPLAEKYKCKVTIAIVENYTRDWPTNQMSKDEVREVASSEYISIQSHTTSHFGLEFMEENRQRKELASSQLFITRLVQKIPFVLVYPYGSQDDTTSRLMDEYYHFGVKMFHIPDLKVWNTADDPYLIWRYFPQSFTPLEEYAGWLEDVFGPIK